MSDLRLGGILLEHPSGRERAGGAVSSARLQLWTETGRDRGIALSEDDLVRLLVTASKALAILRGVST